MDTEFTEEPIRSCVVCRRRFPKGELERYVCPATVPDDEPDGPVLDPEKIKPGRGYYVCVQARCRELFPKVMRGLMNKRKGDCK
ncbi:YlxR family protein [Pseudodesulfovibrio sp.]|uniref:YlxR family protein n=1 Tax=unclassified Pseudodesulfovibrio TaxID=2661612 RepID=UPI003AFFB8FE